LAEDYSKCVSGKPFLEKNKAEDEIVVNVYDNKEPSLTKKRPPSYDIAAIDALMIGEGVVNNEILNVALEDESRNDIRDFETWENAHVSNLQYMYRYRVLGNFYLSSRQLLDDLDRIMHLYIEKATKNESLVRYINDFWMNAKDIIISKKQEIKNAVTLDWKRFEAHNI
jgi:hypothetical protein